MLTFYALAYTVIQDRTDKTICRFAIANLAYADFSNNVSKIISLRNDIFSLVDCITVILWRVYLSNAATTEQKDTLKQQLKIWLILISRISVSKSDFKTNFSWYSQAPKTHCIHMKKRNLTNTNFLICHINSWLFAKTFYTRKKWQTLWQTVIALLFICLLFRSLKGRLQYVKKIFPLQILLQPTSLRNIKIKTLEDVSWSNVLERAFWKN